MYPTKVCVSGTKSLPRIILKNGHKISTGTLSDKLPDTQKAEREMKIVFNSNNLPDPKEYHYIPQELLQFKT